MRGASRVCPPLGAVSQNQYGDGSLAFEACVQAKGLARADKTLKNVEGAWIKEQKVVVTDGKVTAYRVNMLVTFVLGGDTSAGTARRA